MLLVIGLFDYFNCKVVFNFIGKKVICVVESLVFKIM